MLPKEKSFGKDAASFSLFLTLLLNNDRLTAFDPGQPG